MRLTIYAAHATTVRPVANAQGQLLAHFPFAVSPCTLWAARAVGPSTGTITYQAPKGRCATGQQLVGTGIEGQVTRGPITPACIAEQPCDGPAPNVAVTISKHGIADAHTTTSADGSFAISLPPGHYTVTVTGRTAPQTVGVRTGHISRPRFHIDTGIR